jgi:IS30 family transposase
MKKKNYKHIKKAERLEIAILLKKGYKLREIARVLERSVGTLSDEIRNNSVDEIYDPHKANHKAYVKRKYSKYQGMKVVSDKDLRNYVEEKIIEGWSPETISGRITEVDTNLKHISPKGIYKFVYSPYGRVLENYLPYHGKKKKSSSSKSIKIDGRVFIDQRPKIVLNRQRFGDWEGDFIVSGKTGKGVLLVLHERKGRYAVIRKIESPTIEAVHNLLSLISKEFFINTLTLDNDIIFRRHQELSRLLGAPIYFCHPYHSWEKGGVENTNKLIRRYIPKSSDISQYSEEYIQAVQDKLNNRPKKCLSYKTPLEVMEINKQFRSQTSVITDEVINFKQFKKAECSA